jgi:hypothetical protein
MSLYKINLLLIFLVLCVIQTQAQNAVFQINNDTIWEQDTLFVNNNITIDTGVCLQIMPGKVVVFQGYYHILSYGKIKAIGIESDSIIFTKTDLELLQDSSTRKGGWNGIRLMPRSTADTSVFRFCRFEGGKAVVPESPVYDESDENKGGLIYCKSCGNIIISNCTFNHSYAKRDGAGIYIYSANYVNLSHNHFSNNYSKFLGGAVFSYLVHNLYIENNVFIKNKAYSVTNMGGYLSITGQGSALQVGNPINTLATCKIVNNIFANNYSAFGTIVEGYRNTLLIGNLICNNEGASIFNAHSFNTPKYINNTIMNNHNEWYVAGINILSPSVSVINNIIWHNYTEYPGDPQIHSKDDYDVDVSYSNIMYGFEGEGNINEVPMFVRPTIAVGDGYDGLDADWSLLDESPCVNTGIADTSGLNLSPIDLWGNPRVFGGRIDMGAIENQNVLLYEEALVASSFQVYPNPGYDRLYIVVPVGFENGTFELYDAKGICVLSKQVSSGPAVLYPPHVAAGMYFYRLVNQEKVIASGKWIKTN